MLSWEEGSTIFQVLERIVHFLLLLFPSSHSLLNYRISLCPSYSTFTAQCPNWPLYTKSNVLFLLLISSTFSPFFNISPLLLKYFIYHASRYPTLLFIFFLKLLLKYSWFTMLCQFLLYDKVTQSYIYIHCFSYIIFHPVLSQDTECNFLLCTVGPNFLSTLNLIVCVY